MATIKKTSTTKKTTATRPKVEAQLDMKDVKDQVETVVETARGKIEEVMTTPQAKKAQATVKKGVAQAKREVKKAAKRPEVKKAIKDIKKQGAVVMDTVEQATQEALAKTQKVARRDDVKETVETIQVKGTQVVDKVRELIKAGNVRRIIIKDKEGKSIAEFPLTFGVIGAAALLPLAAIATIAALINECTITVVRNK